MKRLPQASPEPSSPAKCSNKISIVWGWIEKTPYERSVRITAVCWGDSNLAKAVIGYRLQLIWSLSAHCGS